MSKRYHVDFYDAFDGWCHGVFFESDNLEEAKKFADKKMHNLEQSNKNCGEHYGVIDRTIGREIYCTKTGCF